MERTPAIVALMIVAAWAAGAPAEEPPALVFTDVTESSGLKPHLADALNHGVAWGDVDGDSRPDLFLGNFCDRVARAGEKPVGTIPNRLFCQTADGKFVHRRMPSVETRGRTSGAALADLDNDGHPELYVNNNTHTGPSDSPARQEPSALYRNDGGRFVNVGKAGGACPADGAFGRDVGVFDCDGDGLLDLFVVEDKVFRPKAHSRLYRNLGGMTLEDATAKAGLPDDLHGFGMAVGDLSGDGRPDFFVCGVARLYLSQPGGTYKEAEGLRALFDIHSRNAEEYVCGAVFGDIDNDGDLDLIVGTHYADARIRVYLNEGLKDGVPQFRDITRDLAIPALPTKAPTCAIADFDNDGLPDLYWSAWFAEGAKREPFICRGLGVKDGLPRFAVPPVAGLDQSLIKKNAVPEGKRGMVYYVDGPPVDFDGDGRLDFFAGAWPDEGSHLYRNETATKNNWLAVRVAGTKMNRMGIGAKVRVLADGKLLGFREITLNGGYSGSGLPVAHFGLGPRKRVDIEVLIPSRPEPLELARVPANQCAVVTEP